MKFKYSRRRAIPSKAFPDRHSVILPLIPVCVRNKHAPEKFINIYALIDSGADVSIFPADVGKILAYQIDNGHEQLITGINNQSIKTFLHEILLDVGGWIFDTVACFSTDETCFPVLGQLGFFDLFKVTLDYSKEEIELKNTQKPIKIESN